MYDFRIETRVVGGNVGLKHVAAAAMRTTGAVVELVDDKGDVVFACSGQFTVFRGPKIAQGFEVATSDEVRASERVPLIPAT